MLLVKALKKMNSHRLQKLPIHISITIIPIPIKILITTLSPKRQVFFKDIIPKGGVKFFEGEGDIPFAFIARPDKIGDCAYAAKDLLKCQAGEEEGCAFHGFHHEFGIFTFKAAFYFFNGGFMPIRFINGNAMDPQEFAKESEIRIAQDSFFAERRLIFFQQSDVKCA